MDEDQDPIDAPKVINKGGRPVGYRKSGGRAKGTPNKATLQAREAIAAFVEGNTPRLEGWLDDIAAGVKNRRGKWDVRPNPIKAMELVISILEFHVPKQSRVIQTGPNDGPIKTEACLAEADRAILSRFLADQQPKEPTT